MAANRRVFTSDEAQACNPVIGVSQATCRVVFKATGRYVPLG